jgi:hypothetical protein
MAQPGPPVFQVPFPPSLQSYLELTRDQVNSIQRHNNALVQLQAEKGRRSAQVQLEIQQETAKTTLDAMALGVRYLELEAIRREVADQQQKTYTEIQKLLTDAQKTKVQALIAAMRMQNLICDAQAQNILLVPRPGNVIPVPNIVRDPFPQFSFGSFLLGYPVIGGCPTRWFDSAGFIGGLMPAQP